MTMGTSRKSWKRRIPRMSLPWTDSRSLPSAYSLRTMAVELSARSPPKKIPSRAVVPSATAAATPTRIVSPVWSGPPRTNARPIRLRRWGENSSPIENRRKTTPTSANVPIRSRSEMSARPEGPMSMPVTRNPATGGMRAAWLRVRTPTAAARRMRRSGRKPRCGTLRGPAPAAKRQQMPHGAR